MAKKKTKHAFPSAPDSTATTTTSEKKVTFSSPVVTSRKTIDSSGGGSSSDDDATKSTQKQTKREKERVKLHRNKIASVINKDNANDAEYPAKSTMNGKASKASRSRLSAQTLAMLLKLVDVDDDDNDDDDSFSSSTSSLSDRGDCQCEYDSSCSVTSCSDDRDDGDDEQRPVRVSMPEKKKEKKQREHKARHNQYSHADDTAGSGAARNIDCAPHTDLDMVACGSFTTAYADMYPDQTKLYATSHRLNMLAYRTAAAAVQDTATDDYATARRVVLWTQQDCDCLSLLEARQRALKWLDLQAQFYNITGKMVSAEEIEDKFKEDARRTREATKMKEDGHFSKEKKTEMKKGEAGVPNKTHKKELERQDSRERIGTSIGGASKVMTETDDMIASALKKLLKLKQ